MPKTAFLILKSPHEKDPTHFIRRFSEKSEASVILVEDGVYHAILADPADRLAKAAHEVLVSREDLEARGFSAADLRIGTGSDYANIIDCIMERTERTITV